MKRRSALGLYAKGIRLEEPGDVKAALTEALAYKEGPVVVDAVVDSYALSLPSHVKNDVHDGGLALHGGLGPKEIRRKVA